MRIDTLALDNPFVLAPLAGYSDLAFRLLCREMGAGFCCSEMISSHGLVRGQKKTLELLATVPEERPVAFQLFGSDPGVMGDAAAHPALRAGDILDINMGCPVRKVVRKGAGAALMKDMQRAEKIIRAVRQNTSLPVTIKIRSGWHKECETAVDFALMAQEAGAAAVTVHARSWAQGFAGRADWRIIARVKETAVIPVIGNGDILCYQDGQQMMAETGCDGVMIGRGALGNPWVFRESGRPSTLEGRMPVVLRHLELARLFVPPARLLFYLKNHITRYTGGLPGASGIRQEIARSASVDSILQAVLTARDDLQPE
ncbi:MAG TPA: tRNA dihydrouridine synthase DusB [Desulfobacteraceae bacterium]|nr:tRNA dihydrouridine synthase DusB [Desulfobacteraceae bacterium]